MRTIKLIVMVLVFVAVIGDINLISSEPVVRIPRVTEEFKTNVNYYKSLSEKQSHPNHFVEVEGRWSNSYSSGQGNYDYFVVKTKSVAGGRILKLAPMGSTLNGITSIPVFTDVLTGENFYPSLERVDIRSNEYDLTTTSEGFLENLYSHGTMKIGDDVFNIIIAYYLSPRYPTVSITWGEGSMIMDVGTILDTFEDFAVMDYARKTSLEIRSVKNVDGIPDGMYIFVSSPAEYTHLHVEKSNDFKTWNELSLTPYFIYGDITMYPVDSSGGLGFFRTFIK